MDSETRSQNRSLNSSSTALGLEASPTSMYLSREELKSAFYRVFGCGKNVLFGFTKLDERDISGFESLERCCSSTRFAEPEPAALVDGLSSLRNAHISESAADTKMSCPTDCEMLSLVLTR